MTPIQKMMNSFGNKIAWVENQGLNDQQVNEHLAVQDAVDSAARASMRQGSIEVESEVYETHHIRTPRLP